MCRPELPSRMNIEWQSISSSVAGELNASRKEKWRTPSTELRRNSYTIEFKSSQNRERLLYGLVIYYFNIQQCCIALVEHLLESRETVLSPPADPHQPPVAINAMLLGNLGRLLDGHLPMATKVQCSNQIIHGCGHTLCCPYCKCVPICSSRTFQTLWRLIEPV